MRPKVLIFGYGSAGERHNTILKEKFNIKNLSIFTKRKLTLTTLKNKSEILNFDPDIIIISNSTHKHFETIKFIEKIFTGKTILVEKPVVDKFKKFNKMKNTYLVAYQLRFHPVLIHLKRLLKKQKVLNVNIICNSFLPYWRKKNYTQSYSSFKKKGGGVLFDLSHELDYLHWIFPSLKYKYFVEKKISSLKINSEDIAIINGSDLKNDMQFQINLNYFSRDPKRLIIIDTNNFSFYGDLINNFYKVSYGKKTTIKKFKKCDQKYLTNLMLKSVINKNFKNLCSFKSGMEIVKRIEMLRKLNTSRIS